MFRTPRQMRSRWITPEASQRGSAKAGTTDFVEMGGEIGQPEQPNMTSAEQAAVAFAVKLATDHLSITDADKDRLTAHFDPEQIVELALLCVMCLVGRFSMLAGLQESSR